MGTVERARYIQFGRQHNRHNHLCKRPRYNHHCNLLLLFHYRCQGNLLLPSLHRYRHNPNLNSSPDLMFRPLYIPRSHLPGQLHHNYRHNLLWHPHHNYLSNLLHFPNFRLMIHFPNSHRSHLFR